MLKHHTLAAWFTVCILGCSMARGQLANLDVKSIPENLKKNGSVIKRYEEINFEVKSISEGTLDVVQILTVLNESGKDALLFRQQSNKFILLDDAEIKVYDAAGHQTERHKKKDLFTLASGEGLIEDGKVTYFPVNAQTYPVTVEYRYRILFKGTLVYPRYDIMEPEQGVENSTFTAKVPPGLDLRYKAKNIDIVPEIEASGNSKVYRWSVKDLPPIRYEDGAVSFENRYPSVILAPNHFKVDDFEGDMTSWNAFGRWYSDLIKDRNTLSDDRQQFFRQLVKDCANNREKIKTIYRYVQTNCRYVSIQLGAIGGFRPFPASFTDEKKYGDCKGLSNYVQAALAAVGIRSYQALINAEYNEEPVDPNFPCSMFNHVIVCVPQEKDTIWLECTSKTSDFGVLGSFTENRNALLITENGGALVPTPRSTPGENKFMVNETVKVGEDGSARSVANITATGEFKNELLHNLQKNEDEQKTFLVERLGFKQPDAFSMHAEENSPAMVELQLEIEKVPDLITGTKMFLPPRIYKIWNVSLPKADERKQDYYFPCPFEKDDTTAYQLPNGFAPEDLPAEQKKQCAFATFSTKYWWEKSSNTVYSTCRLILNQYRIPPTGYSEVKTFFDDVSSGNGQRIVIKRM